ncbi:methyl-accepting chemotaxis protein [Acidovorax sp. GBBC 3334]|uniref:methyl-accepting chemotaxis protein n=1 Tax=Acidovorax sp. GBBC 3334 TaxID=2940496 RepID=UPI002302DD96|nr:methyl-accepting chemotaxis protein [Acidovorax sp. GBBC 3334]MDA8455841.1 methyl-accepting chemotaxis protein [Acidovorax sp. GBBC 3334]
MRNLSIGARLGGGFALVLVLMALMTAFGLWRLQTVAQATHEMTQQPLANERMISDWYRYVDSAARRTTAIVKSTDPSLAAFFAEDSAMTTRESAKLVEKIEPLLDSPAEKAVWADISKARAAYLASRDQAVKAKAAGQAEEAERILNQVYLPATKDYVALIQKLLDLQRSDIDATAGNIQGIYAQSRLLLVVFGLLALALGAACALWLTRGIVRPLSEAVRVARAVAASDLTSHVTVDATDETGQLLQALKDMNESLAQVVGRVRSGTDSIATASNEIDAGNQDLSSRTEEQASSLQQTAASMEELTSTVRQNADNARQANQLASSASETATKGGQVVAGVVDTMGAIHESSRKISDIIGVIDGIAFQTNILALNAAVEAARAGEQGRGFAVVASEVRALAGRSAAAAKDIKGLIGDSVSKVSEGTQQVAEAGRTMDEIVQSVQRVSDLVAEISAASEEQSRGIDQVHQAVSQMDQVTQQNAALVEEATAATGSLKAQASQLAQAVSVFRIPAGVQAAGAVAAAAPIARPAPAHAFRAPAVQAPRPAVAAAPRAAAAPLPARAPAAPALPRAPAAPSASASASRTAAAPPAARGGDDDWETF